MGRTACVVCVNVASCTIRGASCLVPSRKDTSELGESSALPNADPDGPPISNTPPPATMVPSDRLGGHGSTESNPPEFSKVDPGHYRVVWQTQELPGDEAWEVHRGPLRQHPHQQLLQPNLWESSLQYLPRPSWTDMIQFHTEVILV
jgi:hypothetical protein